MQVETSTSVSFSDTDGDRIELRFNAELNQVQEYVNGQLAVHNVRYFYIFADSAKFQDVGGFGILEDSSSTTTQISEFFGNLPISVDFQIKHE